MQFHATFHKKKFLYNVKIVVTCAFFLFHNSLMAGAWLQGKGQGYTQFGFSYLHYNKMFYNAIASTIPRYVTDITWQWYQEYGISDNFDLICIVPFKKVYNGELNNDFYFSSRSKVPPDQYSLFGPGNIELGIKYALKESNIMQSLISKVIMPTAIINLNSGLNTGYDGAGIYGSYLLGKGWQNSYFSGELGLYLRNNGFSNDLSALLEYGRKWKVFKKEMWLVFVLNIFQPINKGSYDNELRHYTGLYASNTKYISPGLKLNYNISKKPLVQFIKFWCFEYPFWG